MILIKFLYELINLFLNLTLLPWPYFLFPNLVLNLKMFIFVFIANRYIAKSIEKSFGKLFNFFLVFFLEKYSAEREYHLAS